MHLISFTHHIIDVSPCRFQLQWESMTYWHIYLGGRKNIISSQIERKIGRGTCYCYRDAGGPLWQFAAAHAWDYLRDSHNPSLIEWARFLSNLRSICQWKIEVCMDGRVNTENAPDFNKN